MPKWIVFILAMLVTQTACSVLQPVTVKEPTLYTLIQINPAKTSKQRSGDTLLITLPKAQPGYDATGIAYTNKPYQLNYYTQSRWVASPANMLMPLLVQSLQNTRYFKAVTASPYAGPADLRLDTEIAQIEQRFFSQPSQVKVVILAQLVDNKTQMIIASRQFTVIRPAPTENAEGGVIAANQAVADLLQKIADFVTESALPKK